MAKSKKVNPEVIILAVSIILAVAVVGYIIKSNNETPDMNISIGATASERIEETASLQDELFILTSTVSRAPVLININTADVDTLTRLEGIGETKAKAIIDYRVKNGNFSSAEEIMNVKGIGEKTYENIKDKITVK